MLILSTVTGLNFSEIKSDIRSFILGIQGAEVTIFAEDDNLYDRFSLCWWLTVIVGMWTALRW